jgi:hypothetical protein
VTLTSLFDIFVPPLPYINQQQRTTHTAQKRDTADLSQLDALVLNLILVASTTFFKLHLSLINNKQPTPHNSNCQQDIPRSMDENENVREGHVPSTKHGKGENADPVVKIEACIKQKDTPWPQHAFKRAIYLQCCRAI